MGMVFFSCILWKVVWIVNEEYGQNGDVLIVFVDKFCIVVEYQSGIIMD